MGEIILNQQYTKMEIIFNDLERMPTGTETFSMNVFCLALSKIYKTTIAKEERQKAMTSKWEEEKYNGYN